MNTSNYSSVHQWKSNLIVQVMSGPSLWLLVKKTETEHIYYPKTYSWFCLLTIQCWLGEYPEKAGHHKKQFWKNTLSFSFKGSSILPSMKYNLTSRNYWAGNFRAELYASGKENKIVAAHRSEGLKRKRKTKNKKTRPSIGDISTFPLCSSL